MNTSESEEHRQLVLGPVQAELLLELWPVMRSNLASCSVHFFLGLLRHSDLANTMDEDTFVCKNDELFQFALLLLGLMDGLVERIDENPSIWLLLKHCNARLESLRALTTVAVGRMRRDCVVAVLCNVFRERVAKGNNEAKANNESNQEGTSCNEEGDDSIDEFENALATFADHVLAGVQHYCNIISLVNSSSNEKKSSNEVVRGASRQRSLTNSSRLRSNLDMEQAKLALDTLTQCSELHCLEQLLLSTTNFADVKLTQEVSVGMLLRNHLDAFVELKRRIDSRKTAPIDAIVAQFQSMAQHLFDKGLKREQIEIVGPLLSHAFRPALFAEGKWTSNLERAWALLFQLALESTKANWPQSMTSSGSTSSLGRVNRDADPTLPFPGWTQALLIVDTWAIIQSQLKKLGEEKVTQLFQLHYTMKFHLISGQTRYKPTNLEEELPHLRLVMQLLLASLDPLVHSLLPDSKSGEAVKAFRQLQSLREPLDWLGQVFCNAVRPLLLIRGKWSSHVEEAWAAFFGHIIKRRKGFVDYK